MTTPFPSPRVVTQQADRFRLAVDIDAAGGLFEQEQFRRAIQRMGDGDRCWLPPRGAERIGMRRSDPALTRKKPKPTDRAPGSSSAVMRSQVTVPAICGHTTKPLQAVLAERESN